MSVTMPATLDPLTRRLGRGLRAEALRDAAASAGVLPPLDHRPVSEDDLTPLPEPARRYLRSMGVVGRERDHGFLIRLTGRFRLRGRTWMPFEAWQCNLAAPVTRVFRMRIDAAAAQREGHLDGKWLLRTSDVTRTGDVVAAAYKLLLAVVRGWGDM